MQFRIDRYLLIPDPGTLIPLDCRLCWSVNRPALWRAKPARASPRLLPDSTLRRPTRGAFGSIGGSTASWLSNVRWAGRTGQGNRPVPLFRCWWASRVWPRAGPSIPADGLARPRHMPRSRPPAAAERRARIVERRISRLSGPPGVSSDYLRLPTEADRKASATRRSRMHRCRRARWAACRTRSVRAPGCRTLRAAGRRRRSPLPAAESLAVRAS